MFFRSKLGTILGTLKNKSPVKTGLPESKKYPRPESNRHECNLIGF